VVAIAKKVWCVCDDADSRKAAGVRLRESLQAVEESCGTLRNDVDHATFRALAPVPWRSRGNGCNYIEDEEALAGAGLTVKNDKLSFGKDSFHVPEERLALDELIVRDNSEAASPHVRRIMGWVAQHARRNLIHLLTGERWRATLLI